MKKKILITGANRKKGIGNAIASCLSDYDVLTPTREELDLTNFKQMVDYIYFHKPDMLINNAGFIEPCLVTDQYIDTFKKHFEVNVFGPFVLTQHVLKYKPYAKIINIGSSASKTYNKDWAAYSASKAANHSLSMTMINEQINCYIVHPPRTNTDMRKSLFGEEDPNTLRKPEEIAEVVFNIIENKETRREIWIDKPKYVSNG